MVLTITGKMKLMGGRAEGAVGTGCIAPLRESNRTLAEPTSRPFPLQRLVLHLGCDSGGRHPVCLWRVDPLEVFRLIRAEQVSHM